ncbi:ricin-type beta-trefoil lectin domain protein [Sorangium atrum]|uniref:ricin-type beta-trefoil lectin domain protein n=1 Tax=Sorangium atrum TaxID=2995308 RepID=UPI00358DC12E
MSKLMSAILLTAVGATFIGCDPQGQPDVRSVRTPGQYAGRRTHRDIPPQPPGYVSLVNAVSNLCLGVREVDNHGPGAGVEVYTCNPGGADRGCDNQWRMESTTDGFVHIKNRVSNLCLGVRGVDQHGPGAEVEVYHCAPGGSDGGRDNQWRVKSDLDGSSRLENRISGLCLGVRGVDQHGPGAGVEVYPCNPGGADNGRDNRWRVEPVGSSSACEQATGGVESPVTTFPLVAGTATWKHPAIGVYTFPTSPTTNSRCTATLVASRLAITAAHCVIPNSFGTIQFFSTTGTSIANRRVIGSRRFRHDGTPGHDDVGFLMIDDAICRDGIAPEKIADSRPKPGADITVYGYGCTSRAATCPGGSGSGGGSKTFINGRLGKTVALCPGDSGGPVFHGSEIIAVNSGYECNSGNDIFGYSAAELPPSPEHHYEIDMAYRSLAQQYSCLGTCPDGQIVCPLDGGNRCLSPSGCSKLQDLEEQQRRERDR